MECVFCKITEGIIPSKTIYEDDKVKVFLDINPDSAGHTLIIPKEHYVTLEEMPSALLYHISDISKKVYKILNEKLKPDGITIVQNNGLPQLVKHYHLHLIPKYKEDKIMDIEDVYNVLKD